MPLSLVSRVLEGVGALVEASPGGGLQVLLPDDLRLELALPEAPLLTLDGRDGSVPCGHGTELFQRLVARAVAGPPLAVARAALPPPRPRAPDGYGGLNVALRPGEATLGEGWTLSSHLRVEAVADERRLYRMACAVALGGAACPIDAPAWDAVELQELDELPDAALLALGEAPLSRAMTARALAAVEPFRAHVARRLRRDLLRVEAYFAELDADLVARAARSKAPEALQSKRAALPGECGRRVASLREAAVLRVRVSPAALLLVRHPVLEAPLEVLRRKARRTLVVRYHPVLRRWLPLACEACGAATSTFGACDEAVHVLCAACLQAGGERRCARCARGAPPPADLRLELTGQDEPAPASATVAPAAPVRRAPERKARPGSETPRPRRRPALDETTPRPPTSRALDGGRANIEDATPEQVLATMADLGFKADAPEQVGLVFRVLASAPGPLAASEIARLAGLDAGTVRNVLLVLEVYGAVDRTGRTRATRYALRPRS